jgi:riboflavin-specific deaminase-like protein
MGRSYVSLKLALTLDGRLAARDGSSRWISGEAARARVHRRRAEVDAVMVGAGTVAADDPRLTARHGVAARQPARVIVDSSGRTSPEASVFAPGGRVIVATTDAVAHETQTVWKEAGAEVLVLSERGGVDLEALLKALGAQGMLEVQCEGGARLATSLLRADLVDRLELYYGPLLAGAGGVALGDLGVGSIGGAPRWATTAVERCGDDAVIELVRAA